MKRAAGFNKRRQVDRPLRIQETFQPVYEWLSDIISDKQHPYMQPETNMPKKWSKTASYTFLTIMIIFGVRVFLLQISQGGAYLSAANGNRIRDEITYAPRGTIYDRNGKILARNTVRFQLAVTPYLLAREDAHRQLAYETIARVTGLTTHTIKQKAEQEGINYTFPLVIDEHLSHNQTLKLEQELPSIPGFSIDAVPQRKYASQAGLAHILGYVSRVSKSDLAVRTDLLPTDSIGRSGIEAYYDHILRGRNGRRRAEVDSLGRPLRLLAETQPTNGNDITLTLDLTLQHKLARELQRQMDKAGGKRASGLVLDPYRGEVLAMVSIPYYDNNLFAAGISAKDYKSLIQDPDKPLLNRVVAGTFPSGSTIKPLVAAGALQEGVVDEHRVIVDRGYIAIPNPYNTHQSYRFRGWQAGGLGPMNVRRALAYSSNIYFYTVGGGYGPVSGLGPERLLDYYKSFGLGQKTGIDIVGEVEGRLPSPAWKQETLGEKWYLGDTYNISIGQGDLRITPIQMALSHAAIANGGQLVRPYLLKQTGALNHASPQPEVRRNIPVSPKHLSTVRAGMHDMPYRGVFSPQRFSNIPVEIAGKTGTAQTSNPDGDGQPHGWFIAFAPFDRPEVVVLALMENVRGSTIALDPVVHTLEYIFRSR